MYCVTVCAPNTKILLGDDRGTVHGCERLAHSPYAVNKDKCKSSRSRRGLKIAEEIEVRIGCYENRTQLEVGRQDEHFG